MQIKRGEGVSKSKIYVDVIYEYESPVSGSYVFVGYPCGFHKVMKTSQQVSSLLDGGFQPAMICAHMGYSPLLVRTVQKLKGDGKSLTPQSGGGRPRKKGAAEADEEAEEEGMDTAGEVGGLGESSLEGKKNMLTELHCTPHWMGTQDEFWIPIKIPAEYGSLMPILPENTKKKKNLQGDLFYSITCTG